jgi:hypothetical protein
MALTVRRNILPGYHAKHREHLYADRLLKPVLHGHEECSTFARANPETCLSSSLMKRGKSVPRKGQGWIPHVQDAEACREPHH